MKCRLRFAIRISSGSACAPAGRADSTLTRNSAWGRRSKEPIVSQAVSTEHQQWTIGGLLDWTARYLVEKGAEFPRLDAEVLLAHALECRRIDLYTRYEEPAPEEARAR